MEFSSNKNVKISPANLDSIANITNVYIAGHGWGVSFHLDIDFKADHFLHILWNENKYLV